MDQTFDVICIGDATIDIFLTLSEGNNIENFSFNPSELKIKRGETVAWENKDFAAHTIVSDFGNELSSAALSKGKTYSHAFNAAGAFDYHCGVHPSMKAKIIVE